MANDRTIVLELYKGEQLASFDNGTGQTHWSAEDTWELGPLAREVRAYMKIHEIDALTDVSIVAEWSVDRITWATFATDIMGIKTATGLHKSEYTTGADFGPFVRFGVQVADNTAAARKTATVTVTLVLET